MEKEYYYLNGDTKVGPLSLDDLKNAPITRTTLVWYHSIPDWVEAYTLPELAEAFMLVPPPPPTRNNVHNPYNNYSTGSSNPSKPPLPDNYLIWAILTTVFCCWPIGIFSIISAARVNSAYNAGDYQRAESASDTAKKLVIVTACVGAISLIIVGIVYAIMGVAYLSTLGFAY